MREEAAQEALQAPQTLTAPILSGGDDAARRRTLRRRAQRARRRVVERLVDRLREELGQDLLAVWLYGSRARGEADPSETDPDRRSDVDLLAIVGPERRAADKVERPYGWTLSLMGYPSAEDFICLEEGKREESVGGSNLETAAKEIAGCFGLGPRASR